MVMAMSYWDLFINIRKIREQEVCLSASLSLSHPNILFFFLPFGFISSSSSSSFDFSLDNRSRGFYVNDSDFGLLLKCSLEQIFVIHCLTGKCDCNEHCIRHPQIPCSSRTL